MNTTHTTPDQSDRAEFGPHPSYGPGADHHPGFRGGRGFGGPGFGHGFAGPGFRPGKAGFGPRGGFGLFAPRPPKKSEVKLAKRGIRVMQALAAYRDVATKEQRAEATTLLENTAAELRRILTK
ncbi:hypothetical protein [Herbiconiux liangxiaofengii]|uniref:hypothetical protein n=1 Tax=Herbiconiux liangxiaofengii TaxID=3342795 RepID=UPI0035BB28CF